VNKDTPRELATLYARYIDDRSFERLEEIMATDILVAAPNFECQGLAAFKEQLQLLHNYSATLHLIGNQFGEWQGDTYEGETYCVAHHVYAREGEQRMWEVGIRYRDSIALVDGSYKYTGRYLNVLWQDDRVMQDPPPWP